MEFYDRERLDFDLDAMNPKLDAEIIYDRLLLVNKCTRNELIHKWLVTMNFDPNGEHTINTIKFMIKRIIHHYAYYYHTKASLSRLLTLDLRTNHFKNI